MNKNKATKEAAHENQDHYASNQPQLPKSSRGLRLLTRLSKGAVMRHDADDIIGTGNAPEYVKQLRRQGWDIYTERVPMVDRDGKKISVGRYHLSAEHQALARKLLSEGG